MNKDRFNLFSKPKPRKRFGDIDHPTNWWFDNSIPKPDYEIPDNWINHFERYLSEFNVTPTPPEVIRKMNGWNNSIIHKSR